MLIVLCYDFSVRLVVGVAARGRACSRAEACRGWGEQARKVLQPRKCALVLQGRGLAASHVAAQEEVQARIGSG